jgi:hypothetical protein
MEIRAKRVSAHDMERSDQHFHTFSVFPKSRSRFRDANYARFGHTKTSLAQAILSIVGELLS